MVPLTDRQNKILKVIIEEYIETAEPVGSETLDKKYSLGISPATIRNEMVRLTEQGYLRQPHTSSGRVPTSAGFKFYIENLMEKKDLTVAEEVAAKEAVWDHRFELDHLLREMTRTLANRTRTLAVATTDEGDLYSAGYANILDLPEFYDIDVTRSVLSLLDEESLLQSIFDKVFGEDQIHILFGEEIEREFLQPCSLVFTHFEIKPQIHGAIGVIGPSRLNYPRVIPMIEYFGNLITDISKNW